MGTLKADVVTAVTTNGNLTIQGNGTGSANIVGYPHRNLIINGDMRISQRGVSFADAFSSAATYTVDRFRSNATGSSEQVATITQDTDVPNNTFRNSVKIDITTAESAVAVGEHMSFQYFVEGFDSAHLALGTADATTFTLSFWVKAVKTGIYCVSFINSAWNRSYPVEYTINSGSTWEKKTISLTGDVTGTWIGATNGMGLQVNFTIFAGSNFHGTNATWAAGGLFATSNQVNGADNTANNIWLTGVQLEVGSVATDFEHRDYASELARCMRYYWRDDVNTGILGGYNQNGFSFSTSLARMTIPGHFRAGPTVRVSPAYNVGSGWLWNDGAVNTAWSGAPSLVESGTNSVCIQAACAATLTKGHACVYYNNTGTNGYIELDAEL